MKYKKSNISKFRRGGLTRNEKAQAEAVKGAEFYQLMLARNNASKASSMADRMKAMDPRKNDPEVKLANLASNSWANRKVVGPTSEDILLMKRKNEGEGIFSKEDYTFKEAFAKARQMGLSEFQYGRGNRIAVKLADEGKKEVKGNSSKMTPNPSKASKEFNSVLAKNSNADNKAAQEAVYRDISKRSWDSGNINLMRYNERANNLVRGPKTFGMGNVSLSPEASAERDIRLDNLKTENPQLYNQAYEFARTNTIDLGAGLNIDSSFTANNKQNELKQIMFDYIQSKNPMFRKGGILKAQKGEVINPRYGDAQLFGTGKGNTIDLGDGTSVNRYTNMRPFGGFRDITTLSGDPEQGIPGAIRTITGRVDAGGAIQKPDTTITSTRFGEYLKNKPTGFFKKKKRAQFDSEAARFDEVDKKAAGRYEKGGEVSKKEESSKKFGNKRKVFSQANVGNLSIDETTYKDDRKFNYGKPGWESYLSAPQHNKYFETHTREGRRYNKVGKDGIERDITEVRSPIKTKYFRQVPYRVKTPITSRIITNPRTSQADTTFTYKGEPQSGDKLGYARQLIENYDIGNNPQYIEDQADYDNNTHKYPRDMQDPTEYYNPQAIRDIYKFGYNQDIGGNKMTSLRGRWKDGIVVGETEKGKYADDKYYKYQKGGQLPESGISEALIADFVVRFLSSQGMGEEQILDPSGQGFSQEAQQMVMPILEQIGEDPQFWQAYQQDPDGVIGQIAQSPEQVAMARKGARLEMLRKGGKKKKMKSRKCECGCEITTVREEGGKLSSKCACGCK